jgi:hypothetical protein
VTLGSFKMLGCWLRIEMWEEHKVGQNGKILVEQSNNVYALVFSQECFRSTVEIRCYRRKGCNIKVSVM